MTYCGVKDINIGRAGYEVKTYFAATENSCKGAILCINPATKKQKFQRRRNQPKNSTALVVRRIKNTRSVIVRFGAIKVPFYITYAPSIGKCSLYYKNSDICYAFCRLSHGANVCRSPEDVIWCGCHESNLDNKHD
ncbi:hypothetical protein HPB48_023343 [Haemaphysalis longicornis]|uniref:Uncharacterized protein n=1 Tax=Haemaphysalis longicornis TaxID=44386 RepID=A0A9J6H7V3_HAELO|nr:hypothetical protein HPB48_023343 [Haemaphysalis longicornis]